MVAERQAGNSIESTARWATCGALSVISEWEYMMAVAKRDKGSSEFGGAPGMFGNVEAREAVKPILEPHQEMTSLKQTNKDDPQDWPRHGTGGRRVK